MKHFTLFKPLLIAVAMLLGGVSSAWADEVFGTTSDGYLAAHSTPITMYDGGTIHYVFSQSTRATNNFDGFVVVAENRGGTTLIALRQDNWDNVAASNTGCTNNYNWMNFPALLNGASVDMTITYESGTFTMASTVTGSDANDYSYGYTKSISGSPAAIVVYLSEEAAQITLTTSDYSNSNVVATLDHTASSKCSTDNSVFTSTVDSELEHINNSNFNGTWAAAAYADFTFTIPTGHSVTSAQLTFTVLGSTKDRTADLSYVVAGTQLDYSSFSGGSAKVNLASTNISAGLSFPKSADKEHVIDVTDAVRAIVSADQDNIIFKLTNNIGGGDLYGKGATVAKQPILIISTSAETLYTATFTESNSLTPTVSIYSDSERTEEVANSTLHDGTTYYYRAVLDGYTNYDGSFTVSGSDPSVNFTMTAKPRYTFTVNAVNSVGGAVIQALYTDDDSYDGKSYFLTFPAYLTTVGNAVTYSKDNSTYGQGFTSTTGDATKTISYTAYTGTAYFYEGEDVTGATRYTTGTFRGRSSNGATGVLSENTITSLDEGVYRITVRSIGKASNTHSVYKTSKSGEKILDVVTSTTGTIGSAIITLEATTDIVADGGYYTPTDNGHGFDYFLIEKIESVPATIGSTGWTTFASPYALDLSGLTASDDVTAYYASKVNTNTVTMTSTDTEYTTVAAGTGLMLKGTPSATITIPVVASGSAIDGNLLVGCPSETVLVADADKYVLVNNGGAEFQSLKDNGATIPAGKAYLDGTSASVKGALRIEFDDNATGVKTIDNGQWSIANGKIFNLAGQRMSKMQRGINIVNGKKIIK